MNDDQKPEPNALKEAVAMANKNTLVREARALIAEARKRYEPLSDGLPGSPIPQLTNADLVLLLAKIAEALIEECE